MLRVFSMADNTILETARLRLRTWDEADIDPFMAHLNTPTVTRWLDGVKDRAFYEAVFQRMAATQAEHGHSFWIVERRADRELLGFCGIRRGGHPGTSVEGLVELGWRLREDVWRQGLAREAALACLDWGWENLPDSLMVAYTVPGNVPSWSLMQKIGMTHRPELDFDHPAFAQGHELCRHIVYGIDRPRNR